VNAPNMSAPRATWVDADLSLRQLADEIARLESRQWTAGASPVIDPWLAEAGALRASLEIVEWQHNQAF
jgi:hypothetical protein